MMQMAVSNTNLNGPKVFVFLKSSIYWGWSGHNTKIKVKKKERSKPLDGQIKFLFTSQDKLKLMLHVTKPDWSNMSQNGFKAKQNKEEEERKRRNKFWPKWLLWNHVGLKSGLVDQVLPPGHLLGTTAGRETGGSLFFAPLFQLCCLFSLKPSPANFPIWPEPPFQPFVFVEVE